jgi:hypothetical protein
LSRASQHRASDLDNFHRIEHPENGFPPQRDLVIPKPFGEPQAVQRAQAFDFD